MLKNKKMNYFTIKSEATASLIEKKSEFIANITSCVTENEALKFIEKMRSENRKARHNVYAYILRENNTTRYSDDGEPSGTAGVPVLEVLKKKDLTDICCVVTRYFGGILLGASGLIRAYSCSCKLAVENAVISHMVESIEYALHCDYTEYGKIKYFLENQNEPLIILNETFAENVKLQLLFEYNSTLPEKLVDITNDKIKIFKLNSGYRELQVTPFCT
ncbi:YigZ family protein [Clostridia bacterium]|nr:YigZ family protein [Clostridia bacterium]